MSRVSTVFFHILKSVLIPTEPGDTHLPPPLDLALVIVHLHIYIMTHVVQLRNVVVIHPIRSPFVSEIIQKTNGRRVQSRIYE